MLNCIHSIMKCECITETPKGKKYHPSLKSVYERRGAEGRFKKVGYRCPNCGKYYDLEELEGKRKMSIEEIKNKIENIKAFGDIPLFSVNIKDGLLQVCQNDGQFHTDREKSKQDGYATYIGTYTPQKAIERFSLEG